ncbi:MAG: Formiminotransferase-cyclodeaminase [Actinomycetia bacterium]|nr:Formiminotransferase-cyclodeaminase [Actinomycetes bacterium]
MTDPTMPADETAIDDVPVGEWLAALASDAPAPGGGAAAAMNAAMAAALVEMVCNLTTGKAKFADHDTHITRIRSDARTTRRRALQLVADDADAFTALMASYRIPKDRPGRAEAIQSATEHAASVPLRIAWTAAEALDLAEELPGRSNPNVASDIGVAAANAVAAIQSAALNVEINLESLTDDKTKARIAGELAECVQATDQHRIRLLMAEVRKAMDQ